MARQPANTAAPNPKPSAPIDRLLAIMARLRDPQSGCPWDVEQNFATIAPYTVEEAYEVADAIQRENLDDLKDELGDLLFQVVFHARMAEEDGVFGFDDVATAIADKMERRHPHVFGEAAVRDASAQTVAWEEQKASERAASGTGSGALDGVPLALPALLRAQKLGNRAARVGFDWSAAAQVLAKVREETDEVEAELAAGDPGRLEHEIGDLLFAAAQLARHAGLNPETALRIANARFEGRFAHMESTLRAQDKVPADVDQETLEDLWNAAKLAEK
jgi:ATP diphosphatase